MGKTSFVDHADPFVALGDVLLLEPRNANQESGLLGSGALLLVVVLDSIEVVLGECLLGRLVRGVGHGRAVANGFLLVRRPVGRGT